MHSRRDFVRAATQGVGVLSTAFLGPNNLISQALAPPSLRVAAAQKGLLYGSAVQRSYLTNDEGFSSLFAAQCGILVPEDELKWNTLRPTPSTFDFTSADWLLAYATRNQMKMRGHTLVWYRSLPGWFAGYASAASAKQLLVDHIDTVVRHYAGKMHSWDVVNEVLAPEDNIAEGWRNSPWFKFLGQDHVELAFQLAHKADPDALLVWNEDHIEDESDNNEQKRMMFLAQLRRLLAKGTPIGGIGIQSHLVGGQPNVAGAKFKHFLDEVERAGLKILVTEMDVIDKRFVAATAQRDQDVAAIYKSYLTAVLERKSTIAVLTWGLSNKYTWLTSFEHRPDGLDPRPLPFDSSLQPTLAYRSIYEALGTAQRANGV